MRHLIPLLLSLALLLPASVAAQDDATGVLRIFSIPGDAQVTIDGELKGLSPASAQETFMIHLPAGEYQVGATKAGFDPVARTVIVGAGTEQTIKLSLAPEIRMAKLPAGCFLMGSPPDEPERDPDEGPQREVCLPAFELGIYEVSFADWDACVRDGACTKEPSDEGWGRGNRPVVNVSHDDMREYLRWINQLTDKGYRLPSEAEWEYAARAETTTPFSTGACIDTDQANYDGTFEYADCQAHTGVNLGQTTPIGTYAPNPWGLYDMHGNVNEMTADCWNDDYVDAPTDGRPWREGNCTRRVMRGGSWYGYAGYMRSAYRCRIGTGFSHRSVGFRLARDGDS